MFQLPKSIFIFFLILVIWGLWFFFGEMRDHLFGGLRGPEGVTIVRALPNTLPALYGGGSSSRMAILLTDQNSAWLGLVHGLKSFGIPVTVTIDYHEALRHKVVMVYPVISGKVLTEGGLKALSIFSQNGGTLIGTNVLGGGLNQLFGFDDIVGATSRRVITLDETQLINADFPDGNERVLKVGSSQHPTGTYAYTHPNGTTLGSYEDGGAAITGRNVGSGHAYAFGFDLGAYALMGEGSRQEGIARHYVNWFEPGSDVIFCLLRNIYVAGEPDAVLLGTVPQGKSLSIIMTHDVDFTRSMKNALQYAKYEESHGLKATYFIQTKYVRDWSDDSFFNADGVNILKQLQGIGMEIASHSVAHSAQFNILPLGGGDERYPEYEPFVIDARHTKKATVLGELRVSRFLLESTLAPLHVVSFRPGHLRSPNPLPQALEATGYRFSSSTTANNSLTHMPFRLNVDRQYASETGMFEFPVTIEDEALPLMGSRLLQALDVAKKIGRYGGLFVVLIHPNILDHKFAFMRGLVDAMKNNAWFGSLEQFGNWWSARDKITVDVATDGQNRILSLNAPQLLEGISLQLPQGWHLVASKPVIEVPSRLGKNGKSILLAKVQGVVTLTFATQ